MQVNYGDDEEQLFVCRSCEEIVGKLWRRRKRKEKKKKKGKMR